MARALHNLFVSIELSKLSISTVTVNLRSILAIVLTSVLSSPAGAAMLSSPAQQASDSAEVVSLQTGSSVDRQIAGGQKHRFILSMEAGQCAILNVEQQGIDLVIRWFDPSSKQLGDADAELRQQGTERAEVVSELNGTYLVSVETKTQSAPTGHYVVRLVELRAATDRDRSLQQARRLLLESAVLDRSARHSEALKLSEQALEIRERVLGPDHSDVATSMQGVAIQHLLNGDREKSETLFKRALDLRKKVSGTDHPEVARTLNGLATIYRDRGDYPAAEASYKQALEIRERVLGPDHPDVATALNNLSIVYRHIGELTKAEHLLQRALEIRERAFGPEHLDVAQSLTNIGIVYRNRGDYEKAGTAFERALRIRQKLMGPQHPGVATTLNELGILQDSLGYPEKAEPYYKQALELWEKAWGPVHQDVAAALDNLANVYSMASDFAKAEPFRKRALEIRLQLFGREHPHVANSLESIGEVYRLTGNYVEAEKNLKAALEIVEKLIGRENPQAAEICLKLSKLYAAMGQSEQALSYQVRARDVDERNIALNLATGSERQKLAYVQHIPTTTYNAVSLHLHHSAGSQAAGELALETILQRKGRVFDAMSDSMTSVRKRLTSKDREMLDELNSTTAQLARLVLNGPQNSSQAEHEGQIKEMQSRRDDLESRISQVSSGSYSRTSAVSLEAVRTQIPLDAALIEYVVYHPVNLKSPVLKPNPHYAAYVLRRTGNVGWADLGPAPEIDRSVSQLRNALRSPAHRNVRVIARELDQQIVQPIRRFLGDASRLLVSPDGALNLIPFEALTDGKNRHLIEQHSFTYLSSGRDLLRMKGDRKSQSAAAIFADPHFGEPRQSQSMAGRRSRVSSSDVSNIYFPPLSATSIEARSIRAQFPEASLLTGDRATENVLKNTIAPRILHIATHGFFLTESIEQTASNRDRRSISATARIENPLLRSGLALAGANVEKSGDDDGVLTALEASSLDLWGTQLVTLSACDTGVGEVETGEGVYGLRRAFLLSGAETLLMSLWPVSDQVTRELMTEYYRILKKGEGRAEALRQVKLSLLKRRDRQHPFYWASFIQSGQWAPLRD